MAAGNHALGILEARGMTALVAALDAMLKTVDVRVLGRHGVGSGWLTVVIEGAVSDVEAAVRVGRSEAGNHGDLITSDVIAGPAPGALESMPHMDGARTAKPVGAQAMGILETRGMVPLIRGADAMIKSAPVHVAGWTSVGGALVHLVVRGDISSVQTALQAGSACADEVGEVYATLAIPSPEPGIAPLLPDTPKLNAPQADVGALGMLETTGYVSAVGGSDAMVKAADVDLVRLVIASGGRVDALVKGELDAVQAAVEAGIDGAQAAGELNASCVVSRPSSEIMACFGGNTVRNTSGLHQAMGLIETRSTVALVKAVDQMLKSADVEYEGRYKVGYFLTASVVRGDVGAVRAALKVGAGEAERYGELVSAHLIPHPYPALEARLIH
ncbi:MAG: BMC domain-containing protein [Gemmatimonadota bacterium]|nr:BMC domain-containing protein [Gemmatimonadota bacterium]